MKSRTYLLFVVVAGLIAGCGPKSNYIAGTRIKPSEQNQELIGRVEEYRIALEGLDPAGLLLMASRKYWEDSGTPDGEDDYGFKGLQKILSTRFQQVESIRYSLRYVQIRYAEESTTEPRRAFVDVMVDASFSIPDARGGTRRVDKRDQNQLVLEWTGEKWMFLSGM